MNPTEPRSIVAVEQGFVYCSDGAVFLIRREDRFGDMGQESVYHWGEVAPIPGTKRALQLQSESAG